MMILIVETMMTEARVRVEKRFLVFIRFRLGRRWEWVCECSMSVWKGSRWMEDGVGMGEDIGETVLYEGGSSIEFPMSLCSLHTTFF